MRDNCAKTQTDAVMKAPNAKCYKVGEPGLCTSELPRASLGPRAEMVLPRLSVLHALYHFFFLPDGSYFVSILLLRKLRLRENNSFAQSHTANNCLDQGFLASELLTLWAG